MRHGISIWIDVPLDRVAREVMENDIPLPASDLTFSGSSSEVHHFHFSAKITSGSQYMLRIRTDAKVN